MVDDITKLNTLVTLRENSQITTKEITQINISQFIAKNLKKVRYHPYEVYLLHELTEDDLIANYSFVKIYTTMGRGSEIAWYFPMKLIIV